MTKLCIISRNIGISAIVLYILICCSVNGKHLEKSTTDTNVTTGLKLETSIKPVNSLGPILKVVKKTKTGKQMGSSYPHFGGHPFYSDPNEYNPLWNPEQYHPHPLWNGRPNVNWNQFYPPYQHGHTPGTRVNGGFFSSAGQFPFVVELASPNKACTGSLFNADTIITAGHCVATEQGEITKPCDLNIYAGSVEHGKGMRRFAQSIYLHPNYAPTNAWGKGKFLYDIAIIRLTQPYEFSKTIRPIPIQQGRTLLVNTTCMITGFGSKDGTQGEVKRNMTYANMKIRPNKLCADTYGAQEYHDDVTVCAGGYGTSICYGDGGGPLHCANANGSGRVLFGIASFVRTAGGNTPCNTRNPGVFTRAPAFDEWVMKCVAGDCTGSNSGSGDGDGGGGTSTIN